jgi:hypothetical protein
MSIAAAMITLVVPVQAEVLPGLLLRLLLLLLLLPLSQWELIAGPDLLELLNEAQGRMSEAAAAFYFVQVSAQVSCSHDLARQETDISVDAIQLQ